jgi:hypothetical protein
MVRHRERQSSLKTVLLGRTRPIRIDLQQVLGSSNNQDATALLAAIYQQPKI